MWDDICICVCVCDEMPVCNFMKTVSVFIESCKCMTIEFECVMEYVCVIQLSVFMCNCRIVESTYVVICQCVMVACVCNGMSVVIVMVCLNVCNGMSMYVLR